MSGSYYIESKHHTKERISAVTSMWRHPIDYPVERYVRVGHCGEVDFSHLLEKFDEGVGWPGAGTERDCTDEHAYRGIEGRVRTPGCGCPDSEIFCARNLVEHNREHRVQRHEEGGILLARNRSQFRVNVCRYLESEGPRRWFYCGPTSPVGG